MNFDICMHHWTITIIKTANISIIPQNFLVPLCNSPFPLPPSLGKHLCAFCHYSLLFLEFHMNEIILYVLWFSSLFLFLLYSIPLYGHITICLFIHLLMAIWVASYFWQLQKAAALCIFYTSDRGCKSRAIFDYCLTWSGLASSIQDDHKAFQGLSLAWPH